MAFADILQVESAGVHVVRRVSSTMPCRSSSPSQHMRQLLSELDSHITHTRMLSSPPPASPPPPPVCPVNITFHGTAGDRPMVSHGVSHGADDGGMCEQHDARRQEEARYSADACHAADDVGCQRGQQEAHAHQLQQHAMVQSMRRRHSPPGRRPRFGSRPRISASDIVPPEKVEEEALKQTRIDYFADVQRIKQKRLQDWGQMFGQAP